MSAKEELNELNIDRNIKARLLMSVQIFKKHKMVGQDLNMNFVFVGDSQYERSTVGRLMAGMLYEEGVLPTDTYIEVNKGDLVQRYIGQAAGMVNEAFKRAEGGVLCFNDVGNIVVLNNEDDKYGIEALSALLTLKEKYRGKLCLILSDTRDGMKKFFGLDQSFSSHFPTPIDFDN